MLEPLYKLPAYQVYIWLNVLKLPIGKKTCRVTN